MKKMNLRALCFSTLKAKHYVAAMAAAVAVAANFWCGAAFIGGTFFAAATMSGCEKDTAGGGDDPNHYTVDTRVEGVPDGAYTPSASDDLKALIAAANATLRAEQKVTLLQTYASASFNSVSKSQYDADNKKVLEEFSSRKESGWVYAENDQQWDYEYDSEDKESRYLLRRPQTNAQKYFMYADDYISIADTSQYTWSFTASGSTIVAKRERKDNAMYSHDNTTTWEVELAADKRYKKVKETSEDGAETATFGYAVDSIAKPADPAGVQLQNIQGEYVSAKVEWGESKGSDTFWGRKEENYTRDLYGSELARYAPDVEGKEIEKFTANGQDYCVSYENCTSDNYSIPLMEGMTITVVWKSR